MKIAAAILLTASAVNAATLGASFSQGTPITSDWSLKGTVIEDTQNNWYADAPSIVAMPDGTLVVAHGRDSTDSADWASVALSTNAINTSTDGGETWGEVSTITGALWGSLFTQGTDLYWIGIENWPGNVVLFKSSDTGETWGASITLSTNLYHSASHSIPTAFGRVWAGFSDVAGDSSNHDFDMVAFSAATNTDLTTPSNWTLSSSVAWGGDVTDYRGWFEPDMVEGDSNVWMINRIATDEGDDGGHAGLLTCTTNGATLSFVQFVDVWGGEKKCGVRRLSDGTYGGIFDHVPLDARGIFDRRIRHNPYWKTSTNMVDWVDSESLIFDPLWSTVGYQYMVWIADPADASAVLSVFRTAKDYNGITTANYHDANLCTFSRFDGLLP